jgi:hypothetical protein
MIPDLSNGHGLVHVVIQDVARFTREGVEDPDCAITMTSSNVFIIGVESHTESLLGGVTQGVLVSDLNIGVLNYLQTTES